MSELDPLPPELRDLFAAEREAPVIRASGRVAVRSKLAASIGKATLGHAAAGTALTAAGKAILVIALAVGAGTVAWVRHSSPTPTPAVIVAPHAKVSAPKPEPVAAPVEPVPEHVAAPVEPVPKSVTARQPRPMKRPIVAPPAPSIVVEAPAVAQAALLRQAWSAMSFGDPGRALELAAQDQQLHRDGALAEEREALQVAALAKLQRLDEARTAAAAFLAKHPDSVHRDLIERSLDTPTAQ
jgi:hypothetical protein